VGLSTSPLRRFLAGHELTRHSERAIEAWYRATRAPLPGAELPRELVHQARDCTPAHVRSTPIAGGRVVLLCINCGEGAERDAEE